MATVRLPQNPNWHRGERYDVCFGSTHGSRVAVFIKDNQDGQVYRRSGTSRQIGNYAPVFVRWKGRLINVEKLLHTR